MNKDVLKFVESSKAKVIIFDIDGTLKDLCVEHTDAVKTTLEQFNVKRRSRSIVLALNRLAMYIVKTGFIPTNQTKQNFLVKLYARICGVKADAFYNTYFDNYTREICLFDGVYELLGLLNSQKEVYFATINKQNYNLEICGIHQERITYSNGSFKVETYDNLVKKIGADKSEAAIIGDNLFDDLFSAKKLGVKCFLVNRYQNRLKSLICKLVNGKYLR